MTCLRVPGKVGGQVLDNADGRVEQEHNEGVFRWTEFGPPQFRGPVERLKGGERHSVRVPFNWLLLLVVVTAAHREVVVAGTVHALRSILVVVFVFFFGIFIGN